MHPNVENPLPRACMLLALALPGLWLAGRELARRATKDRSIATLIAPGLAVAIWMMSMHAAAYVAKRYVPGLVVGTLVPSAIGIALYLRTRKDEPPPAPRPFAIPWMLIAAAISTAAIGLPLALTGAWHDEMSPTGHMSIACQMQNGFYPPRFIPFLEHELRYHYGYDVLCAAVSAIFRPRLEVALDIVTVSSWFYSSCVLWAVGARLIPEGKANRHLAGLLASTFVFLGGGVGPIVSYRAHESLGRAMTSAGQVEGHVINPPMISYFFQHPWTIGLPLAACFLLLALDDGDDRPSWHTAAMGTLLLGLLFGQIVLFVGLAGAWLGAVALRARTSKWRRTARALLAVVAAVAIGSRFGGFFAPHYPSSGKDILFQGDAPLKWQLVSFGLLAPVGVAGLFTAARHRLLLGFTMAGSVFILSTCRYAHTWDIAKFGTMAGIAMALLGSTAIARLASGRLWRKLVAAPIAIGVVAQGFAFAGALEWHLDPAGLTNPYYGKPYRITDDDAAALSLIRRRVGITDVVYREYLLGWPYAYWAGLTTPWPSYQTDQHGFSPRERDRWKALLAKLPPETDEYKRLHLVWFVLGPEDKRLQEIVNTWIQEGAAEQVATFGRLRVVHLL